jgi:hypothetical protein
MITGRCDTDALLLALDADSVTRVVLACCDGASSGPGNPATAVDACWSPMKAKSQGQRLADLTGVRKEGSNGKWG